MEFNQQNKLMNNNKPRDIESWNTVEPQREDRGGWVGRDQAMNLYVCIHNQWTQSMGW